MKKIYNKFTDDKKMASYATKDNDDKNATEDLNPKVKNMSNDNGPSKPCPTQPTPKYRLMLHYLMVIKESH